MLTNTEVSFTHGTVLTREMLEAVYEYPREFMQLQYGGHSDGILYGMDFFQRNDELWLGRGIFKAEDRFYFLMDDMNLTGLVKKKGLPEGRQQYYFQLEHTTSSGQACIKKAVFSIAIVDFPPEKYSLGKFCWERNEIRLPQIKSEKESKEIFSGFFSRACLSLFDVKYAFREEATYHPFLFRAVCEYLQQKKQKSMLDYALLVQLLNQPILSMATVCMYCEAAGKSVETKDRQEIFKIFTDCLTIPVAAQGIVVKKEKEKVQTHESQLIDE